MLNRFKKLNFYVSMLQAFVIQQARNEIEEKINSIYQDTKELVGFSLLYFFVLCETLRKRGSFFRCLCISSVRER